MTNVITAYEAPEIVLIGEAEELIRGSACGMLDADNQTYSQSTGCP